MFGGKNPILLALLLGLAVLGMPQAANAQGDPTAAVSAGDPEIPPSQLAIRLTSLTQGELTNEIAAWQLLLQNTVEALDDVQIRLAQIRAAELAIAAAEESGEEAPPNLPEIPSEDEKEIMADAAGELLAARGGLLDRFKVVLDEYQKKGGDPLEYRLYANAVSGVKVDFSDPDAAIKTLRTWATSEEGGIRLAQRIGIFAAVIAGAYVVGALLSWIFAAGFRFTGTGSKLLRRFVVRWSRRVVFIIGLLIGLSALGVDVTPLVAALGAAGFIVGFALQNTLSNFASGILIMTQRPFDVGDSVEAAGVTGTIDRVTLFNTHVTTFDNSKMVIPNNSIWSSVITNNTAADTKRLSLEYELKAPMTVEVAETKLMEIVSEHPKVLKEPAPVVRMDDVTDDGFKLICWPWVKTGDAGVVRWDLNRSVKERLHAEVAKEEDKDEAA